MGGPAAGKAVPRNRIGPNSVARKSQDEVQAMREPATLEADTTRDDPRGKIVQDQHR